jgi:hypothetical protein
MTFIISQIAREYLYLWSNWCVRIATLAPEELSAFSE